MRYPHLPVWAQVLIELVAFVAVAYGLFLWLGVTFGWIKFPPDEDDRQ